MSLKKQGQSVSFSFKALKQNGWWMVGGAGCSMPPVQRLSLLLSEPGTGTAVQAVPISMIPSCHPSSCRQEVFVFLRPGEQLALCFQQTSESGLSLTGARLLPHVRNFPHRVLSDILSCSCEAAD